MEKSIFEELAAEFPREAISWRVGSMNKEKTKATALAYIDARDVMRRLDSVVGPGNWSDSYYESPKGRVFCTLSIRVNGEWVAKTDGAGDSDVEAEKGAISDAFKRAAVKWGIGRYLYDLPSPWMEIDQYKKLKGDPWQYIKGAPKQNQAATKEPGPRVAELMKEIQKNVDFIAYGQPHGGCKSEV